MFCRNVTNATDINEQLFCTIGDTTIKATWHCVRYLLPFSIYPLVIFFGKLALHFGAETDNSCGKPTKIKDKEYYNDQFKQSMLVAWTFKVVVLIFVAFSVLDSVGIKTGDMLEITTVFSLGLSWSMRDWLASMWGCFMLAFCTIMSTNKQILLNGTTVWLTIKTPGLMFVECTDGEQITYVPNSTLMAQGFTIKRPGKSTRDATI